MKQAKCDNCGNINLVQNLDPIEEFDSRTETGDPIPAGQCTECGSLSYLIEKYMTPTGIQEFDPNCPAETIRTARDIFKESVERSMAQFLVVTGLHVVGITIDVKVKDKIIDIQLERL